LETGKYSTGFAADFLSGKFSVYTKWKDGMGQVKRLTAILVKDGKTLSETLAENGMARIHGFPIDGKWNGRSNESMRDRLRVAEKWAQKNQLGGYPAIKLMECVGRRSETPMIYKRRSQGWIPISNQGRR